MDKKNEYTVQETLHYQMRKCSSLIMRLAHNAQREHLRDAAGREECRPGGRPGEMGWMGPESRERQEHLHEAYYEGFMADEAAEGPQDFRDFRSRGRRGGKRGIAHAQGRLLRLLNEHDGLSLSEIVDQLDVRPSSASELVSKLEQQGYVRRETNADDKRVTNIFITDGGRQHYLDFATARSDRSAEIFEALSDEEQKQLSELLGKLLTSLKEKVKE